MIKTTENGKILIASDIHYGLSRNSKNKLNIIKEYVEPEILSELQRGDEEKTLIICGDLFHEMVSVRTDIYKEAKSFLVKCSEFAKVILIAGNHDCYEDTTAVTSIELFEQLENISVIRFNKSADIYGLKCAFLPWSDNNEKAFEFNDNEFDCVFCHPDVPKEFFRGIFTLENTKKYSASSENKKIIDEIIDEPTKFIESFNFSLRNENDKIASSIESIKKVITIAKENGIVFAGHIHKHSESYILGRKFSFIGSPYQTTSEEINTKSGFYIINSDGLTFKEIKAPEYVRIKFSDIKRIGVENYDFSLVTNNIIQFDGDEIITVEMESKLKKSVIDAKPYEMSDTDYSNLVIETTAVKNADECSKALNTSPKYYVTTFLNNLPEDVFTKELVSKEKIIENFNVMYDLIENQLDVIESNGGAFIKYKRLHAKNFLSYDTLEFDFEKHKGLTLICGENLDNIGATNACGKSNILKAIVYALFGQTPKKVNKTNISSWGCKDDTFVSLELESNGVNYYIEFGKNVKDVSYYKVVNLDTGVDVTKKQIKETRKFIEDEILHCNFDTFMKTTILTSSEIFNFYSMKKEDKEDYLTTIFGTKVLNNVRDMIKNNIKTLRNSYLEKTTLLESKEHDIEITKDASERFEVNRVNQIKTREAEIFDIETKIAELKESNSPEKAELLARLQKEKEEVVSELNEVKAEISKYSAKFNEYNDIITKNKISISHYQKELLKHKDVAPKLCNECKKIIAEGYGISEYANKISKLKDGIAKYESLLSELNPIIPELEEKRSKLSEKIYTISDKISNNRTYSTEISRLESSIESKKSTIEYITNQENPNIKSIILLEEDKKVIESNINELEVTIRHLDFIQRKVVSQDVITTLLTDKFIKQLNERIRYYLQRLGLNLGVEFDNDFHYDFTRGDGAHPEFNSLSGGETLRIVIATSFAFKDFLESRRNVISNIRFLDEFFEKDTDNLGMNSTISILKDFSKILNQNVFLVSNKLKEIDDSVFDNILVVKIKDSRSFIEEEKNEKIVV